MIDVLVQVLPHGEGLPLPDYGTALSAGADLRAAIDGPLTLAPGARMAVPCGFCMALPAGWEGQVRPRSGLALRHGLTVANAPGTIDADYRGEVKALLINLGAEPVHVARGDRIAQLVLAPVTQARWTVASDLDQTERGSGGFGSTGR